MARAGALYRVHAALAGRYDAALLSRDEAEIFDDLLGGAMDTIQTDEERKFWSEFKYEPNTDWARENTDGAVR